MNASRISLLLSALLLTSSLASCGNKQSTPSNTTDGETTARTDITTNLEETESEVITETEDTTETETETETETQTPPEPTTVTVTAEYSILVPHSVSTVVNGLSKHLRSNLAKQCDIRVRLLDDAEVPAADASPYEIVIGLTDRPESIALAENLQGHEWSVTVKDQKIYIVGKTDHSLLCAFNYFNAEYIEGKDTVTLDKDFHFVGNRSINLFENGETVRVHSGGSYPRIYQLRDGTLLYGIDGWCFRSEDDGATWSSGSDYRQNYHVTDEAGNTYALSCANTAFYEMEDGTILVAYRATGHVAPNSARFCTKILVSQSTDGGKTWSAHSTMCEYYDEDGLFRGTWEPHFGLLNGVLTAFYANDSRSVVNNTDYQHIEYVQWIDGEWTNRTIVANGLEHISRDGMPVWQQLSDGRYVCAIEGWLPNSTALAIQLFYSDDGITWSEPVTIYQALNGVVGAPYVVEIPGTNRLVVSFQTSENLEGDEAFSEVRMFSIVSDGTPIDQIGSENFSAAENVFGTEPNKYSIWNGLYVTDKYLYACTGTNGDPSGMLLKRVPLADVLAKLGE